MCPLRMRPCLQQGVGQASFAPVGTVRIGLGRDRLRHLDRRAPGELVEVEVLRDGKTLIPMKIPLVEVQ